MEHRSTAGFEPPRVFYPELSWQTRLSGPGCLLFAAFGVWMMAGDSENLIPGLFVASTFFVFAVPYFALPREIVFSDAITIKRRLLADKRIEYDAITSFGLGYLKARHGGFRWHAFENGSDLYQIFDELIESGAISDEHLTEWAQLKDLAEIYAVAASLLIALLVAVLLWTGIIPKSWTSGAPDWVFKAAIPLAILGISYLFFRFIWFGARMRLEKRKRS